VSDDASARAEKKGVIRDDLVVYQRRVRSTADVVCLLRTRLIAS